MFPYRDDNPTILTPYVTVGIIILTTLVWIVVQGAGTSPALPASICHLGAVPAHVLGRLPPGTAVPMGDEIRCEIAPGTAYYTLLTSVFLHGGWFHLIGNMWFLWVFGNNVEDAMGHTRFIVFYLVCGLVAALSQTYADPNSAVPLVGASGAISGVMGAYLLLYPRVRVHMLVWLGFFVTTVAVPAYLMLVYWALLQLLGGLGRTGGGGIAFMAHVGGFVAGLALIRLFAKPELLAAHRRMAGPALHGDSWS